MNALLVSSSASHPCPTCCIHVPISETVWPIQKRRKFRWTWSALNGLMDRLAGSAGVRGIAEDYTRPTPGLYVRDMRFHTYSKFSPEAADAVDLQALLDKLADFLLQSGFAGGDGQPYYGMGFDEPGYRTLE